jgi:hypothetical protein
MKTAKIDNPDLHLTVQISETKLKQHLLQLTGVNFTVFEDWSTFEDPNGPWVYSTRSEEGDLVQTVSVYGVIFPLSAVIQWAKMIPCQIITDYWPDLKQHQWQLIQPDGSQAVVVLDETESGVWYLPTEQT